MKSLFALVIPTILLLAPARAGAEYPTYTPDEYAGLVCESDVQPIWNDDYVAPAPMCAMRMIVEMQAVLAQCAYGSAEHCLELVEHVVKHGMPCFEIAAKLEQG